MLGLIVSRHYRPHQSRLPLRIGAAVEDAPTTQPEFREGERSSLTHEDSAAARLQLAETRPGRRDASTDTPTRADAVVDAVARRDFGCLAAALPDDVHLLALLPGGVREWHGRAGVNAAFTGWFDGFDEYELVDAEISEVGRRLYLSWRLRVRTPGAADRSLLVEQHVYADVDADGQIPRLSLLCSGFWRERARG